MNGKIPIEDLDAETRAKLKLGNKLVNRKLIVLGRVLQTFEPVTTREALWVLRTCVNLIKGFAPKGTRA